VIDDDYIEPYSCFPPVWVFRKGDFCRCNNPSLLTRLNGVSGAGERFTRFDFHERGEAVSLCDQVNLTCRRAQPTRDNRPAVATEMIRGLCFGSATAAFG
jgi:hypothetical protein